MLEYQLWKHSDQQLREYNDELSQRITRLELPLTAMDEMDLLNQAGTSEGRPCAMLSLQGTTTCKWKTLIGRT